MPIGTAKAQSLLQGRPRSLYDPATLDSKRSVPLPMKLLSRHAEGLVFLFIIYSVVTHFIELETTDSSTSTDFFFWSEVAVGTFFTVEYIVRWVASRSWAYPLRAMAIVDLLAILPFYLGFLVDLRALRLVRALRIVRLFKLYRYTDALQTIQNAFHRIRYEFAVIGFALLTLGWVGSVVMFELERDRQPEAFAHLSDAVWYTIVTFTTVGYGDKVPQTMGGKIVAFALMLSGLGLFGTFVSLVGSSFLEELRRKAGRCENGQERAIPEYMLTPGGFSPEQVLEQVRGQKLADPEEAARLLVLACETIIRERQAPG